MSVKKEYVTADGFRFPEEQKELAEKHELHIDMLKAIKSLEDFIRDCVTQCIPDDTNDEKALLKRSEVHCVLEAIDFELSGMD